MVLEVHIEFVKRIATHQYYNYSILFSWQRNVDDHCIRSNSISKQFTRRFDDAPASACYKTTKLHQLLRCCNLLSYINERNLMTQLSRHKTLKSLLSFSRNLQNLLLLY